LPFHWLYNCCRKQIFIYEWLQRLVKVLPTVGKPEIKENQKKMVEQILMQIQQGRCYIVENVSF
jgi:hypothetical protein